MLKIVNFFKSYRKIILLLSMFLIFGFFQRQMYPYFLVYVSYFVYIAMRKKDRNKIFELCMDLLFIILLITGLAYGFHLISRTYEVEGLLIIFLDLPMFMLGMACIGMDIVRISNVLNFKLYLKAIEGPLLILPLFVLGMIDEYFLSKYLIISMWLMISYFIIYFIYMIYNAVTQKNRNNIFELCMDFFFAARLLAEVAIILDSSSVSRAFIIIFEIPMFITTVFYIICDIVRIRKERKANVC